MDSQNALMKTTARLVVATLIVTVMVVGKSFLVPMAWALLIGLASYRFLNRLEEKTVLSRSMINMFFVNRPNQAQVVTTLIGSWWAGLAPATPSWMKMSLPIR